MKHKMCNHFFYPNEIHKDVNWGSLCDKHAIHLTMKAFWYKKTVLTLQPDKTVKESNHVKLQEL